MYERQDLYGVYEIWRYLIFEQIRGFFKMFAASAATAALSEGHRAALDANLPASINSSADKESKSE